MSRSLKPTRPVSIRLIFEWEARMTSPASCSEMRLASRSRLKYAPSSIRRTVGLPFAEAAMACAGPAGGPAVVTIASLRTVHDG